MESVAADPSVGNQSSLAMLLLPKIVLDAVVAPVEVLPFCWALVETRAAAIHYFYKPNNAIETGTNSPPRSISRNCHCKRCFPQSKSQPVPRVSSSISTSTRRSRTRGDHRRAVFYQPRQSPAFSFTKICEMRHSNVSDVSDVPFHYAVGCY